MKIVLRAFGNKLSGVMEVPEETGMRFKLAMMQPQQFYKDAFGKHPMESTPLEAMCEFEFTGSIFHEEGHEWHKAREYQLVSINKR